MIGRKLGRSRYTGGQVMMWPWPHPYKEDGEVAAIIDEGHINNVVNRAYRQVLDLTGYCEWGDPSYEKMIRNAAIAFISEDQSTLMPTAEVRAAIDASIERHGEPSNPKM